MKLKANVNELKVALKKIMPFVGDRNLEGLLFEVNNNELVIKSYNGISNAKVKLEIRSDDNFKFHLKGKEFNSLVNTFDKLIDIELNDSSIILSENKSKIKLNVLSLDMFPEGLVNVDSDNFELENAIFTEGLRKTINFVDNKNTSGLLNGINLDFKDNFLTLTSTDSVMCSLCKYPIKSDIKENITLPYYIAKELVNYTDEIVRISVSEKNIKFEYDDFVIVSSLLTGKFPNVNSIIPRDFENEVKFAKSDIENVFKKLSLISTKDLNVVTFNLGNLSLEVNFSNNNGIELNEWIDVKYNGEKSEIKLDYTRLMKIVENFEDEISIKIGDSNSRLLLFENNENIMLLAKCA